MSTKSSVHGASRHARSSSFPSTAIGAAARAHVYAIGVMSRIKSQSVAGMVVAGDVAGAGAICKAMSSSNSWINGGGG
jgi:hypothetical protein